MNIPTCLDKMTPEQQTEVLTDLRDWVEWLTRNYLRSQRDDVMQWRLHPGFTRELLALKDAWCAAYDPGAPGNGPLLWHQDLHRFQERMRGYHADLRVIEDEIRSLQREEQLLRDREQREADGVLVPESGAPGRADPAPALSPAAMRDSWTPVLAKPAGRRFRSRGG